MSSYFLHPGFLWLAPLVALPILIHLLNRIRYRRMRWAAMEFLLASERRAVRRARLRQLLLMALRTLLLAGALLALAQPILRGTIAAILGGTSQVAVIVDASASMSAGDASGSAFERATKLASGAVQSLPSRTRATAGTFTASYDCPFRQPLLDHGAVASVIENAKITSAGADVPGAIREAAASLKRAGGGGTVWLLTDLQAADWRADRPGAWQKVRDALQQAGKPRVVITDLAPTVSSNLSIASLKVSPAILVEGDRPKLTATIALHGAGAAVVNAALFLDGKRIDTRTVELGGPEKTDAVFHLPKLTRAAHAGYVQLGGKDRPADAVPADNRCYFVLRTLRHIPLLVIDGMPSSVPFDGAADFLTLALEPAGQEATARSPFSVKTIPPDELAATLLSDYAAVFLADVRRLEPQAIQRVRSYVRDGGLVMIFPGAHTSVEDWNAAPLPGIRIASEATAERGKPIRVAWVSPTNPVTANLPAEGLDRLLISRLYHLATHNPGDPAVGEPPGPQPQADPPPAEVLMKTDTGHPLLVRTHTGKGKVYLFAVSCQSDFSNLPFSPVLLLTVHRALHRHLIEAREPLARPALEPLRLTLPPGSHQVLTPDGRALPAEPIDGQPGRALFHQTALAGVYRLVPGKSGAASGQAGTPLAAVNVPPQESSLQRIDPETIRSLLGGHAVSFLGGGSNSGDFAPGQTAQMAQSGFWLAAAALGFLLGEVLLAWSIGRRATASRNNHVRASQAPHEVHAA